MATEWLIQRQLEDPHDNDDNPETEVPWASAFAFRTYQATPEASIAESFWGGIGGERGEGCLYKALLNDPKWYEACDQRLATVDIGTYQTSKGGTWQGAAVHQLAHESATNEGLGVNEAEKEQAEGLMRCDKLSGMHCTEAGEGGEPNCEPNFVCYLIKHDDDVWTEKQDEGDDLIVETRGHREYPYRVMREAFLDAVELLCEASENYNGVTNCDGAPPKLETVNQLSSVGAYIECLGRKINDRGAVAVFRNVPEAVLDPFRSTGSSVYEVAAGEQGQSLSDLRIALMDVYEVQSQVGHLVTQFGTEMQALQSAFVSFGTEEEMATVRFESQRANEIASCLASASQMAGISSLWDSGRFPAAAATCANSFAQIHFADQMRDLEEKKIGAEKETAISRFNGSFSDMAKSLDGLSTELAESLERVNAAIGRVMSNRSDAARAFDQALWLMSAELPSEAAVSSVLTNRKALALERYRRAEGNARKLAYLAKRAIEQRIGVRLSDMKEELPLVDPPANWESRICAMTGVNYEALREGELDGEEIGTIADGFIGDYVTRLEGVIESYRIAEAFQDGKDTTILSMRDDVVDARRECMTQSHNLLIDSEKMDAAGYGEVSSTNAWYVDGCFVDPEEEPSTMSPRKCVAVGAEGEKVLLSDATEASRVYTLRFGNGGDGIPCAESSAECGWTPGTTIGQRVLLDPGDYVLSWYQRVDDDSGRIGTAVSADTPEDAVLLPEDHGPTSDSGWRRHWRVLHIGDAGAEAEIAFTAYQSNGGTWQSVTTISAPMLESAGDLGDTPEVIASDLGSYEGTDNEGRSARKDCEDTNGSEFRKLWKHGCMKLCENGYTSDCASEAESACYWELAFPISQRAIDAGDLGLVGGFARGNFNYRIRRIGANVVGTGIRDCSEESLSQACNGGGYATVSLEHNGPYLVRNHMGTDYPAVLRVGKIEHARALAAERYITNPIGSADKTLLEDYMRRELAGRPLNGTYVLRLWDEPGFDFSAVEDIQLVLEYGYWTRQE